MLHETHRPLRIERGLRFELDRLLGLAVCSADARDRMETLCGLALRGLQRMYLGDGAFVHTMRGDASGNDPRREGDSLRYAAIVALGLSGVGGEIQRRILRGQDAAELALQCARRAASSEDAGAVALSAWAAAEVAGSCDAGLMQKLEALMAPDRAVETVACAWALSAALAAHALADTAVLTSLTSGRLLAAQAPTGLFPHILPASAAGWTRAHVGCFADQVYPIQALARLSSAANEPAALAAADACAARISMLQGPAGQWWWHYDVRDGSAVEGYPVYSVHQHAMAPMALLDLWDAGGSNHWPAIVKGLEWIDEHPESPARLVSERHAVIWRKIGRRDPVKAVRSIAALTSGLKRGWRLPGVDIAFPPDQVDYECRPYEFGWMLYAWRSRGIVQSLHTGEVGTDG